MQTDVSKAFQQHKDDFDTANVMCAPAPSRRFSPHLQPPLTPPSRQVPHVEPVGPRGIVICRLCILRRSAAACCPQVNPQLYSAFRMPGSVEYEDKDKKAVAVKYGPKADEGESSLKEGERCPGFPFNPHRE